MTFRPVLLIGLLPLAITSLQAQYNWANTGTDFNTGANWSGGNVPSGNRTANFLGTATNQPNLSANASMAELNFQSTGWDLTASSGATLTLSVPADIAIVETGSNLTDTVDAPVKLSNSTTGFTVGASDTLILNGRISTSSSASVTLVAGAGSVFEFNGGNTYTGNTRWTGTNNATTIIGNTTAFGSSNLVAASGSILTLTAGVDLTGTNKVANAIQDSGKITFNNNKGFNLELGGTFNLEGAAREIDIMAGITTFDGVISNDGGNGITLNDSGGAAVLAGANTYTGATTIYGTGSVSVSQIGNSGTAGNLGTSGTVNLGSSANSGTLIYTGTGETTNRTVNLAGTTGGGEVDASGTGALVLSSFSAAGVGVKTFTLGGTSTAANTFSSAIVDSSSGSTALAKAGTGTWILTGANTYTGGTTIGAGTLAVGAANALSGATGLLTINGGTLAVPMNTTIGGSLTLSGGALNLGANQITLASGSNLTLSGGTIGLTLGTSSGQIIGSGTLTVTGGSLSLNGSTSLNYGASYQVFSGFGTTDLSFLSITGYDTADYTAQLDSSGDLSFSAVPEPRTYALIFGTAALGFAAWSRSKQNA